MRTITKTREPASLSTHRMTPHSDYGNYCEKQELRVALVREQRGLCCYCMKLLEADRERMKIEHWQCQEDYGERQLDYANLLGACLGGEGQPEDKQHCDTRKGRRPLKFNPADSTHAVERRIHYDIDGTVTASDPEFNSQLNTVLGLNLPLLKNSREAIVDGLATWLRDYRARNHRGPDVATLQRMRTKKLSASGSLQPYVQVAVWWLDQRLAPVAA